jgi:hypothetical protein
VAEAEYASEVAMATDGKATDGKAAGTKGAVTKGAGAAGASAATERAGAEGLAVPVATTAGVGTTVAGAGAVVGPETWNGAAGAWALVVTSAPAATVTLLPLISTLPPGTASWLPACNSRWPPWASNNKAAST